MHPRRRHAVQRDRPLCLSPPGLRSLPLLPRKTFHLPGAPVNGWLLLFCIVPQPPTALCHQLPCCCKISNILNIMLSSPSTAGAAVLRIVSTTATVAATIVIVIMLLRHCAAAPVALSHSHSHRPPPARQNNCRRLETIVRSTFPHPPFDGRRRRRRLLVVFAVFFVSGIRALVSIAPHLRFRLRSRHPLSDGTCDVNYYFYSLDNQRVSQRVTSYNTLLCIRLHFCVLQYTLCFAKTHYVMAKHKMFCQNTKCFAKTQNVLPKHKMFCQNIFVFSSVRPNFYLSEGN
jgi:hypothetical protein